MISRHKLMQLLTTTPEGAFWLRVKNVDSDALQIGNGVIIGSGTSAFTNIPVQMPPISGGNWEYNKFIGVVVEKLIKPGALGHVCYAGRCTQAAVAGTVVPGDLLMLNRKVPGSFIILDTGVGFLNKGNAYAICDQAQTASAPVEYDVNLIRIIVLPWRVS